MIIEDLMLDLMYFGAWSEEASRGRSSPARWCEAQGKSHYTDREGRISRGLRAQASGLGLSQARGH